MVLLFEDPLLPATVPQDKIFLVIVDREREKDMMLAVILLVALVIAAGLIVVKSAFIVVHTSENVILERFGRFHKVVHPGFHFKIPFIDTVKEELSLQVQQLNVNVETKTKDNVFVSIPVAVQYQVLEGHEYDAVYGLQNPQQQFHSYVQDNVRTSLAGLTLDRAFESKDDIALDVEKTLKDRLGQYGYRIVNTLVTDIAPAAEVRDSMNQINAAQRKREASITLADADKAAAIKKAEGEAETSRLRGVGISNERMEISKGLAEQTRILKEAGIKENPVSVLLMNQWFQTMSDVAAKSSTNTLYLPSNPGGFNTTRDEMLQAFGATGNLDVPKKTSLPDPRING